jgi:hypothetical protein
MAKQAKTPEADRVPIGFRVPPALKRQIEDAAEASGRSQAQELELMIQQGFDRRALLPETLEATYGPQLAALMLAIGEVGKAAGPTAALVATSTPGTDWLDVPIAYKQVRDGVIQILDAVAPAGDAGELPESFSMLGVGIANGILEEMASGLSRTPTRDSKRAQTLHALAGSLAERLKPFNHFRGGKNAR